jgi:DNA polymerase-4
MDAFFASVEQAKNPSLKGKPVAVTGKSIVIAASYEARKVGVHLGLNRYEAERICPKIKIISANHADYSEVSNRIALYLNTISPTAVMYSIDEGFVDITDNLAPSSEIGGNIREWLKGSLNVTGSVGVGPSYVTAKMATKVFKPDGYCEVSEKDRLFFMDRFPLKDIWGIGRRTESSLNSDGIFSLADIRRCGEEKLKQLYGSVRGGNLFRLANGLDSECPIADPESDYKSMSRSTTAKEEVKDADIALAYLLKLSEAVSARARRLLYSGRTVHLYLRNALWKSSSYRRNLHFYTSASHHIYEAVKSMFLENVKMDIPLRVFGVCLGELRAGGAALVNLEDCMDGSSERYIKLYKAIDKINSRFHNGVQRCATLKIKL